MCTAGGISQCPSMLPLGWKLFSATQCRVCCTVATHDIIDNAAFGIAQADIAMDLRRHQTSTPNRVSESKVGETVRAEVADYFEHDVGVEVHLRSGVWEGDGCWVDCPGVSDHCARGRLIYEAVWSWMTCLGIVRLIMKNRVVVEMSVRRRLM